jgi:hypothetical protein
MRRQDETDRGDSRGAAHPLRTKRNARNVANVTARAVSIELREMKPACRVPQASSCIQ